MNASDFRELVSGRRRGVMAALARGALRAAEVPYSLAVRWRNRQYDRSRKSIERVDATVISVGNLTLGGTGKTPLVVWLARQLRLHNQSVAIVSRGYGAAAGQENDEALEIAQTLPDVPHIQNPDRVAAARRAIEQFGCQAIVLDDGFQHRQIHRDWDIVLLDALAPFGYEHVFPRGALREPLSGLGRADVIMLSRADLVDVAERQRVKSVVADHAPDALWVEAAHRPRTLLSAFGSESALETLAGRPIAAFCGIGNPAGFRQTLVRCGFQVSDFREFPDHFAYGTNAVESLANWAAGLSVEAVLCTCKDLVKLRIDRLGPHPLWALAIGLEITSGQAEFEKKLISVLALGRK